MTRHEPNGPTDPPPTSGTPPTSKYKKLKSKPSGPSEIVIDPDRKGKLNPNGTIREEAESTAVFTFGRFNPPTVGHEKLIHKVESVAKEHGGQAHIVASHTENKSKDPLPQDKKLGYLKKVASKSTQVSGSSKESPNFLHTAKKLHQAGHKHLVMVAGSDRVKDYEERLNKYNGHPDHYSFKSIKVVSAGARDPDAEGIEGMSGTKMRSLARSGKHSEFKAGLPKALHPHAKEITDHIRSIPEETVLEGAVLGVKQRMLRGIQAKKNKAKLALARKIAKERMAKGPALKRRAQKIARKLMRVRTAGKRAKAYNTLSIADKIALDRLVKDKSKIISAIAGRVIPKVRTREVQRLAGIAPQQRAKVPMMMSYDPAEMVARPSEKKDPSKQRRQTEYYRKPIEDSGLDVDFIDGLYNKILNERQDAIPVTLRGYREANTKDKQKALDMPIKQQTPSQKKSQTTPTATSVVEITAKEDKALQEKAEASGVSVDILRQIFQRGMKAANQKRPPGMTNQQNAFARIASFLNKGKAYQKEDADLAKMVEKVKKQDPNTAHRLYGTTSLTNIYKKETPGQVKEEKMKGKDPCWKGYEMVGHKIKNGKKVPNCVPEERMSFSSFAEATYQGKKVPLNKPMAGDVKKSKVYVDPDGDGIAKKVNFGDKNMTIKKDIPARRKSFRARHNCDNPGPKDKPRYWSCKKW